MNFTYDLSAHQKFADSITPLTIKRTPVDQLWQILRDLTSSLSAVSQALGANSLGARVDGTSRGPHLLRARIEDALHDVGNAIRARSGDHGHDVIAEPHPPTDAQEKRRPKF